MEFIKVGKNYMIKNGNGRLITEKEKLELENRELIIKDIQSNECQGKTTQKLTRNKRRLEKIEKVVESKTYRNPYNENIIEDKLIIDEKGNKILKRNVMKNTALQKENADETIKETDSTL